MTTYVIVAYDISDNGRRSEAAERLKGLGFARIQRSLYIARGGAALAKDAYRALLRVIDRSTDSVFVAVIPSESFEKALTCGLQSNIGEERSRVL
uniref:CRISPR-associated endoribonuclease Cas2 n=1 Tax=Ignisphaera aggregans TaxID=334771 RepID=A0A7C4BBQ2_9CREN